MVQQGWIINCLKMYKISDEVMNFMEKTVELIVENCGINWLKRRSKEVYSREIRYHHYYLKCTGGYKLSKLQEKINYLMYMDDIKLFAKNEKELGVLIHAARVYDQHKGMKFGIEKCATLIIKSGKRRMTDRMELPNQEKTKMLGDKETYKYLGMLGVDTIKQVEGKEKFKNSISGEQESHSK